MPAERVYDGNYWDVLR